MEDSKTTSGYVYEDEFSFVNKDNELFLKESSRLKERKICTVDEEEMSAKVDELKQAYADLKEKVEAAGRETVSQEQAEALEEEVRTAEAIGDYDALFEAVDDLKQQAEAAVDDEPKEEASADNEDDAGEALTKEEAEQQETEAEDETEEDKEDPVAFYRSLLKKAESLSQQNDWSYVSSELDELTRKWGEGPDTDSEDVKKLYQKFTRAADKFEDRKREHYEKLNERKRNNLTKKKEQLSELRSIIDNEEWSATGKVGKIKNRWSSIGVLPADTDEDELNAKFDELIATFDEHKVDRLVQKRQKEEDNLMLKLIVLDKMEKAVSSIDEDTEAWKKIDEEIDDLTKQWKKIGRVPAEKSNHVWGRYKSAQDEYYDRKYKYDKKHRQKVDKFRSKKEKICKDAEALLEEKDLATAARQINKLHRRWKKVGNLPQRDEDELWDRFKAATDAFNERKSENIDKIHKQEEEHYRQKLKLIEQAEELKETTDWDKGHRQMQSLMDKWKTIGPVSRKKSNKIWKRFKGAMDVFYDRRREHFKEIKEERKDNLKEKQEILEKLRELGQHEDPIEAVNIAKSLQAKFKEAGYVPIKKKNKIWKQYRKACDVIYDRFRAAKSGNKFDQELAKADLDPGQRKKIQDMRKEFKKVKKEVHSLEEEVLQYKESKTYFKPSGKGNALLDEIQGKIDKAENKLQEKQNELDDIAQQMEDIKADA